MTVNGDTTVHYAYDASGNETKDGDTHYAYNLENELSSLKNDAGKITYSYTGDDLLASKAGQGDRLAYSWDTNAPLAQLALERNSRTGVTLRS